MKANVSERVAMSISGHKTISVFQRYNIVAPQQLHTAMESSLLIKKNAARILYYGSTCQSGLCRVRLLN